MKTIKLALLTIVLALAHQPAFAATNECGANTELGDAGYLISASGGDDTETIQCALDSAASQGLGSVRLDIGEFRVTGLETSGFVGIFEGTTRAGSALIIENESAECGDDFVPAASLIVFEGGTVTVRYMSIEVDEPCSSGVGYNVLEFTQASCEVRTHFANVDRVDFRGAAPSDGGSRAIKIFGKAECLASGEGPLGTFKLNRSTINGFSEGVRTGMLGGGQVDINFNEITNVLDAITIFDANQNTTITGNDISSVQNGVWVATANDWAPGQNRTVVHNNNFETLPGGTYYYGVDLSNYTTRASHSGVVTNNTFNMTDKADGTFGVFLGGVDGALVSGNIFNGTALVGMVLDGGSYEQPIQDVAIIGNNFSQTSSYEEEESEIDIFLSETTERIIVGPQSATTSDNGLNNEIL